MVKVRTEKSRSSMVFCRRPSASTTLSQTLPDEYPIQVRLRHLTEKEATPQQSATSANGQGISDGIFRSNLAADDTEELIANSAHLSSKAGKEEVVKAKYLLGADGAHSWVRNQLGFKLKGDSTDYIWGVLDIIPITDFPDIRMRCAIHSESDGSVMVIPRENKLVRLYIQLTVTNAEAANGTKGGQKFDRSTITPETVIASAQRIMRPYKITYKYLDWWTAYQIGQRVGDSFTLKERVFLAGDAVHTHSPKAGQGMNVSMQDAYNLGWKVAGAVKGLWGKEVLRTYQSERRRIAQDLIDFDHRFSRLFSGRPAKDVMDEEGISMSEFKTAFEKGNMFASGIAVDYGASAIVAKEGDAKAAGRRDCSRCVRWEGGQSHQYAGTSEGNYGGKEDAEFQSFESSRRQTLASTRAAAEQRDMEGDCVPRKRETARRCEEAADAGREAGRRTELLEEIYA